MQKTKRGGFNVIAYDRTSRLYVIRRVTLSCAIELAEQHSKGDGSFASIRRLSDSSCVGLAVKGQFRFDAAA
jgi:hypothetical protein